MRSTGGRGLMAGIAGIFLWSGGLAPAAEKKFRNFNLTCLAPLLEKVDSEAPANMQLAFLRGPSRAPELREDLGTVDFPISTQSPEAAAYFNQGVALLHGLANRDAERCFRQVLEHDAHHPMAYWGLAMANEQRPGRARLFTQNAVRRVRNDTSARERAWIAVLGNYYNLKREGPAALPPAEKLSDEERRGRFRQRIRDLEAITLAHPDDVEAKAFLLRQLTLDEHRHGMPVTSHVAVDRLARDLVEAAPKHPSRHYHIFLWLAERPEHSLPPAERSASLAPGVADGWRFAGEAYRANGRHHEAVPLFEAALRVQHAALRDRLAMPGDSETLVSNYTALIEALGSMGRIEEALDRARELLSLPRLLSPEKGLVVSSPLADAGRKSFVATLFEAELTARALKELQEDELLQPDPAIARERAQHAYWRAAALLLLGRFEQAAPLREELAALPRQANSPEEREAIEAMAAGLETLRTLRLGKPPELPPAAFPDLPLSVAARAWAGAGRAAEALELAKRDLDQSPGEFLATASFCDLHFAAGQLVPAMSAFSRTFRENASQADAGLPVLARLDPLAARMKLPKRWVLPAPRRQPPGAPPDPAALGPKSWAPPAAPDWSLPNHTGSSISLDGFRGKAVLLNFFLGVECPYCVNQLNRFRPVLDAFAAAGIEMIAISTDPVEGLAKRLGTTEEKTEEARQTFPYPIVADPELATFRAYGAFDNFEDGPMHATFLIGPNGGVLWSNISHGPFNHPELLLRESKRLLGIHSRSPKE